MKKNKMRVLILVFAVISIILVATGFGIKLSIIPGEEGLNTGIYGFNDSLYGELYSAKNPPPTLDYDAYQEGFEMINDDPHNYMFGYYHNFNVGVLQYYERSDLRIEVSQPWHENYREIEYWVERGDEMVLVKGDVWIYHVDIGFSMLQKKDPGVYVYQGIPVWMALVTTMWDRAVQDPVTGMEGHAWGAPISVYVESWQVDDVGAGEHHDVEPSLEGRFITLYSDPDSLGTTIDDLGLSEGQNVNSTLSAEHEDAPDSRMASTAFMRFVLSDFGITTYYGWLGEISGRDFPSVRYKLKVYYLSLGTWTFTKDEAEDWEDRKGKQERRNLFNWWDQLDVFQKIAVATILATIIIVVIIIVLAYTGVLGLAFLYFIGRRGER